MAYKIVTRYLRRDISEQRKQKKAQDKITCCPFADRDIAFSHHVDDICKYQFHYPFFEPDKL